MLFNGKRVYKNAFFLYQVNFHDTESALFHIRMENGVALWLLYNFLLSFCLPICRHRVFSRLNLAVTKNQRTMIVFGEDY